jgi:hypothetical protein
MTTTDCPLVDVRPYCLAVLSSNGLTHANTAKLCHLPSAICHLPSAIWLPLGLAVIYFEAVSKVVRARRARRAWRGLAWAWTLGLGRILAIRHWPKPKKEHNESRVLSGIQELCYASDSPVAYLLTCLPACLLAQPASGRRLPVNERAHILSVTTTERLA